MSAYTWPWLHGALGAAVGLAFFAALRWTVARLVRGQSGPWGVLGWQLLRFGGLVAAAAWSARQGAAALAAFAVGLMAGRLLLLAWPERPARSGEGQRA